MIGSESVLERPRSPVRLVLPAARVALGALFVVAGIAKLREGGAFVEEIANYRLVSTQLAPWLAATLPGVEVACGMALVLGRWTRAAASIAAALLAVFTAATAQAVARGINLDCGCFGAASSGNVTMLTVLRDAALLAVAGMLALKARP
jgi:uncharacterized membrane protein YphA (DoxX/SURF4 family)